MKPHKEVRSGYAKLTKVFRLFPYIYGTWRGEVGAPLCVTKKGREL